MADPRPDLDVDGRTFAMVSSTSSVVDVLAPTHFTYHEASPLVWGEYLGDTVVQGRFVGHRDGHVVSISFGHVDTHGEFTSGQATSTISRDPDGRLRLTEDYELAGQEHVSVCLEVLSGGGAD